MKIGKIHFSVNPRKPQAEAKRELLRASLARFGIRECMGYDADAIVALGGDGTILRAIHEYPGVPVLGLNLGTLGYLSSVEEKDFDKAMEALAEGNFRVSQRAMLSVNKVGVVGPLITALNDVVITRKMSGHAALLDLQVNGKLFTRYMCDGIIVATPTGSTAYSLSAGGPVLMPESGVVAVTAMNPHTLGVRPVVLGDNVRLAVTSCERGNGRAEHIEVYADGEMVFALDGGESVEVAKSGQNALLIELDGYDPCDVMRRKIGWRDGANGGAES